ncbi:MAG: glycosyltransferase family 39 protein, partial [Planctomycetota bacterium]
MPTRPNVEEQASRQEIRRERSSWRWLAIAMIVGLVLRVGLLDKQSLNMDEVFELNISDQSWTTIIHRPNSFPPLFSMVLKSVRQATGGLLAGRWVSVGMGVATIGLVYLLAKEWYGRRTGVIAAILVAVSPLYVYYSQLGRAYAMYAAATVLTMWLFERACKRQHQRDWVFFAISSVFGMYVHYYFVVLLTLLLTLAVTERRLKSLWQLVLPSVLIVVVCLPLAFLLYGDFVFQRDLRKPVPFGLAAFGYTYFSVFSGYSLGPSRGELHQLSAKQAVLQTLPWLVLLAMACLALTLQPIKRWGRVDAILRVFLLGIAPVLLIGLVSRWQGLTYNTRHLFWVGLPCLIFLAHLIASLRKGDWFRWAAVAVLAGLACVGIFNRHFISRYMNEDLQATARLIDQSGSSAFVSPGYMAKALKYLCDDPDKVVPATVDVVSRETLAECLTGVSPILESRSPFLFVYGRPFHGDPE